MLPRYRRAIAHKVQASLPPAPKNLDALERYVDDAFTQYQRDVTLGLGATWTHKLYALWDATQATDDLEWLDLPETPPHLRARLLDQLKRWNHLTALHPRIFHHIKPHLQRLSQQYPHRPLRILELASGDGQLCCDLHHWAARHNLQLDITVSDLYPEAIEAAKLNAQTHHCPNLHFKILNALDLSNIPPNTYDLTLCVQTLHHLTPGQIARLLQQSQRVTTGPTICIDLARQPLMATGASLIMPLLFDQAMTHDASISVRRAYSHTDLGLIAALAGAAAEVKRLLPIHTSLLAR